MQSQKRKRQISKEEKSEVVEGDATHLIERLEAFEERVGVRLEALFAHIDEHNFLRVNGELHPREGATIKQDVVVHVDAYDSSGRLVANGHGFIPDSDKFFGFAAFSALVNLPIRGLSKIRVYPKM